jgi:hypothetical protein
MHVRTWRSRMRCICLVLLVVREGGSAFQLMMMSANTLLNKNVIILMM